MKKTGTINKKTILNKIDKYIKHEVQSSLDDYDYLTYYLLDRLTGDEIEFLVRQNMTDDIGERVQKTFRAALFNNKLINNIPRDVSNEIKDMYAAIIEERARDEQLKKQQAQRAEQLKQQKEQQAIAQKKRALGVALLADGLTKQQKADLKKYLGVSL